MTYRSTSASVLTATLSIAISLAGFPATPAVAQQFDHLQCHAVKDSQKFKFADVTLTALQPGFQAPAGCTIKGKAKKFCVPVEKTVSSTDAPLPPIGPPTVEAAGDYVCYKMKCPKTAVADTLVTDQFGERNLLKIKKSKEICVPAVKGIVLATTTTTTTVPTTSTTTVPVCGDGVTNGTEACDDGVNNGTGPLGCLPGCAPPAVCGDGVVEPPEICDDGVNDGGEAQCAPGCVSIQSCGDGVAEGTELCDDGVNDGGPGECAPGCLTIQSCGDGVVEGTELCDDGVNDGGEGECLVCTAIQICGDGVTNGTETCDDGVNDGTGPQGCLPGCL